MDHDQIMTALGRAVAARWGDLPTPVQRDLFEAAIRLAAVDSRETFSRRTSINSIREPSMVSMSPDRRRSRTASAASLLPRASIGP